MNNHHTTTIATFKYQISKEPTQTHLSARQSKIESKATIGIIHPQVKVKLMREAYPLLKLSKMKMMFQSIKMNILIKIFCAMMLSITKKLTTTSDKINTKQKHFKMEIK
jgi:hypothetical protein